MCSDNIDSHPSLAFFSPASMQQSHSYFSLFLLFLFPFRFFLLFLPSPHSPIPSMLCLPAHARVQVTKQFTRRIYHIFLIFNPLTFFKSWKAVYTARLERPLEHCSTRNVCLNDFNLFFFCRSFLPIFPLNDFSQISTRNSSSFLHNNLIPPPNSIPPIRSF